MTVTTPADALAVMHNLSTEGTLELAVTSAQGDERNGRILALDDAARQFFRDRMVEVTKALQDRTALPYDATYKPEKDHEFEYASVDDFPEVKAAISAVTPTTALTSFEPDDDTFKASLTYSTIVLGDGPASVYIFRRFTKTNELRQKKGIDLLLRDGRFTAPQESLFHFDGGADCIAIDNVLLIVSKHRFRQVFDAMAVVFAQAGAAADEIRQQVPISNFEAFRNACQTQGALADKVIAISRKPYFGDLTIEAIEQTNDDFDFGVPIIEHNGQRMLEFRPGPEERFKLVRLLDDDALTSTMTKLRYVVNSKRES